MATRTLLLAAGLVALGMSLSKRRSRRSLRLADGPMTGDDDGTPARKRVDELQHTRPVFQAGMPIDMSDDADRVRPGFPDYAHGA